MKVIGVLAIFILAGCAATKTNQQEASQSIDPTPVLETVTTELPNGQVTLTVLVSQSDAVIRVMNIKPKYKQGMALKKGEYDIEVTKPKHMTYRKWITLTENTTLNIELENNLKKL